LAQRNAVDGVYRLYLDELAAGPFSGEIRIDYSARLLAATDNSVYQVVPAAVLFPRSSDDVVEIGRLAVQERFRRVTFTPRGAGTGTNGGSLGSGLSVDLSRYMNRILELDLERGTVRVQPGVILDQLNAYLRPHGVFFAPHVATADRATLGGMISNDSCGVGSRLYGRTSRHVESLTVVLTDGARWQSRQLSCADLERDRSLPPRIVAGARAVLSAVDCDRERIERRFPQLDRFLTGYDLAHAAVPGGDVDLDAILSGSEGTLAFVVEAVLRLSPIPAHSALVVATYPSFDDALGGARAALQFEPSAVETVDATILELARRDLVWPAVAARIESAAGCVGGLNLIELNDGDRVSLDRRVDALRRSLRGAALGAELVPEDEVAAFWALRKRGVGLLGNMAGARRPVAFVEDCAVAPARLAEFVNDFRSILDGHGLRYGIYGHVDVGCLHVRPALDLCQMEDRQLLRSISDRVFALVESYGGVMWGEHGKGFRSEYSPRMLGPELYQQMRRIKEAFDPFDQLNPGKVARPVSASDTLSSVESPMRGELDGQISPAVRSQFAGAIACNGNGACFTWDVDRPMCPSMKATGDRVHSPKGRAALMREWLRQLALADGGDVGDDVAAPGRVPGAGRLRRMFSADDFSHEVFDAFDDCLACKACVAECPIHVDIPGFKAEFLHHYHARYPRSLSDRAIAAIETALPALSRFTAPMADLAQSTPSRWLARQCGIASLPRIAGTTGEQRLRGIGANVVAWNVPRSGARVALLLDAFTNFFEPDITVAMYEVALALGESPAALAYRPSGKSLHVSGMLDQFEPMARRNAALLAGWAELGCDIICVEPAVALLFRQEYRGVADADRVEVLLPQEWLAKRVASGSGERRDEPAYVLLSHCTESTTAATANTLWQEIFAAAGLALEIPPVGCCGMAGAFGYKTAHLRQSREIFDMSWGRRLASVDVSRVLATGHSCRTQVERFAGFVPRHPLQVLRDRLG